MPIADLVQRVRHLQLKHAGRRLMIGIAGEPGSGKSTLATRLAESLGDAAVAPMDGFHLANAELGRLDLAERKGAPETFDAWGYLALLRRLRTADEPVVYAPMYTRDVEESIGSAIAIPGDVPIVISEGNYLLGDDDPWPLVHAEFDEVWFVDTPRDLRLSRLIERHERFGKSPEAARAWATGPDEENALVVRMSRELADLVVSVD
ncbi:pantothenate kinase [Frondihabitans sp. PhB188]|uniref:nucleoside/nucleotide kinase family protein n=1 Tax=Frondihabitans sp. PhB188 TaxID=2485200 RepID=UPI000F48199D|nr:nucleoside/nucleotide kinase family protein [Frondihabitans sp. PhB188]ROQ39511.1 pantothenate kinase [Frondihabitans sp. PhB188]